MPNLLICDWYAFTGGWCGSTSRLFDIAAGLGRFGWETTILMAGRAGKPLAPAPEDVFPGRVVVTPFSFGPWPRVLDRYSLRPIWRKCYRALGLGRLIDDPEVGWAAKMQTWPGVAGLCGGHVDVVWGISYGETRSLAAARVLARRLGCPLVLEFQDPCPTPNTRLNRYEERTLAACLESCVAVITTAQALADRMQEQHQSCRGKTTAIHLSYDDALARDLSAATGVEKLTLLYAGSLAGKGRQRASALVRGLVLALESEPGMRGHLSLVFQGGGSGVHEAQDLARELGIGDLLTCVPAVPLPDAIRSMSAANVLVVIKYESPAFDVQVPGKQFQYMPLGKPILGIMGECEAAEILRRSGLGFIAAHEDVEGVARHLLHFWRSRERLSEVVKPDWDYIRQFSRSSMAARVHALLETALLTAKSSGR